MKRFLSAVLAILTLAGCTTTNHSIGSAQFNSETEAYPNDYREVALRRVAGRDTIGPLQISEPATMAGEGPFSPQRWFVCIRGIAPVGSPLRMTVQEHLDNLISPLPDEGHYDVVVLFREGRGALSVEGYNGRLCRTAKFERP